MLPCEAILTGVFEMVTRRDNSRRDERIETARLLNYEW